MTNREKLIDALDLICLAEGGSSGYEAEILKLAEHKLVTLAVTLTPHERKVLVGSDDPAAMLAPQQMVTLSTALRVKATAVSTARPVAGLTDAEVTVLRNGGLSLEVGVRAKAAIERRRLERGQ
jgi:hypothetical protein